MTALVIRRSSSTIRSRRHLSTRKLPTPSRSRRASAWIRSLDPITGQLHGRTVPPWFLNNETVRLTLRAAQDTVTVGGLVAKKVALNLITKQTAKFGIDPFSGIQGTPFIPLVTWRFLNANTGMSAQAQGFFASLIDQGLPCKLSHI